LWQLRAALDAGDDSPAAHLLVDSHDISFNPRSAYTLDVDVLAREQPVWTTADLLAAADLYRGELLPGFYEAWVVLERERLAAIYERRMSALLNRLSMERRWEEAMTWAERWIALGEAPEPAYRALMRAYAAGGDAGRAMATYQRCRQALRDELSVEPSDETRRLAESLRVAGARPAAEIEPPLPTDSAAALDFERRRADLYLRAARRSNRLALGALLGLAAMVGVAVASLRRGR
jgi:DNA-binding SARP family transcriptional activator